ncbi:Annexin [Dendrothele bispora CBS 962.96]|uniref:Annexin n=1 Tax=Dendrothele bispora (strain CBS 962.96) TaxID=1314807 RepID=A0A4S8KK24_DENBC|nr:Annexin [Dendrothele bispora CBS 962.96]
MSYYPPPQGYGYNQNYGQYPPPNQGYYVTPPPGPPTVPSHSYPGGPPGPPPPPQQQQQQYYPPPPGPPPPLPQHGSGFQPGYNPSYTSPSPGPPPPPVPGGKPGFPTPGGVGGYAPPPGPPPSGSSSVYAPPPGMPPSPFAQMPYGAPGSPMPSMPMQPGPTSSMIITYLNAPIPSPWSFGFAAAAGAPVPPDLTPGYDPSMDVEKIRKATKGFGTDEAALISTIAPLNPLQLASLGSVFKSKTGKELVEVIDKETGSWFRTDETLLTELLVDRSTTDLQTLAFAFHRQYGKDIQREVKGDLSAKTERMFTMLLSSTRPPDNAPVDHQAVERDVERLYKAGQDKVGTDEIAFCDIIINRSTPQLIAIVDLYGRKYKSLAKVIKSEFSGHMRATLLHIVNGVKPKRLSEGVGVWRDAKLLEASMKGLGTKDKQLVWRIVRYHWDSQRFEAIKAAYHKKYKKSLESRVASETSGDYKKLLVSLVKR